MDRRHNRRYSDVLYSVQALVNVLYPYVGPHNEFWGKIYYQAGIPQPDGDATLPVLYCLEAFLLNELQELHQETEQLL